MCTISWQQRKQLKKGKSQRVKGKWRNEEEFLNDEYDEEIVEVIDKDNGEIAEEDDKDDDEEHLVDVSFNMASKEDPNFSPGIDSLKKACSSQPIRRSSRWVLSSYQPLHSQDLNSDSPHWLYNSYDISSNILV